jgi:dTDP-4-dehydrorhamnose reductase
LLAEKEVLAAHPDSIIVRVTFYGWSNLRHKPSLAEWILNQLKHGLDVPGFTDVFFCPILANDLAGILLEMHDRELSGVYHVVGSEKISKYEFAVRLAKLFGFDPARVLRSSIDAAKLGAPRPKDTSLDCNKISEALGRSMPDVDAGLRRFKEAGESAKFLEFSCAVGGDE